MILKEMTIDQKNDIAGVIEFNNKAEAEARQYYFELLNLVADEDKDTIKGIISDEINHSIILGKLQEKYTGILPTEYQSLLSLKRKD